MIVSADAAKLPPLPPMERLVELLFDAARTGRDDVIPALLRAGVDIEVQDARGHTPLILATYNDQPSTTALLLAEGAQSDGVDPTPGNSALMGVAFKGYTAIAALLIEAGAQVDRRNRAGQTALMMAALFGHMPIVDLLLAAGADPAMTDHAGNNAQALARAQNNPAMAARLAQAAQTV